MQAPSAVDPLALWRGIDDAVARQAPRPQGTPPARPAVVEPALANPPRAASHAAARTLEPA